MYAMRHFDFALHTFQNYGAVAVELVFPQCAEIKLSDYELEQNEKAISSVISGEALQCQTGAHVITGSRAEGLAIGLLPDT